MRFADVHLPAPTAGNATQGWPLVALASCIKYVDDVPYHSLATQYVPPITDTCRCIPIAVPCYADAGLVQAILGRVSGVVLPGSTSNVDPIHYGDARSIQTEPYDPVRDATVFPMIAKALEMGMPVLAICRGLQELNVALGGTLHPAIHDENGRLDHRAPVDVPRDQMFAPAHEITLRDGSVMAQAGLSRRFSVCSLHHQGIARLGEGLQTEAAAPDGTVEMISMPAAPGFVLGVQWHPEYLHARDQVSVTIFELFRDAVAAFAQGRRLPLTKAVATLSP